MAPPAGEPKLAANLSADVAAAPVDIAPQDPPPAPTPPAPVAQEWPLETEVEAPLAEERRLPPPRTRADPSPSEVESRVKRARDDLLGEEDARIQEDALASLVELGPRLAGPELVRQLNARRRGVRANSELRALWRRVRRVLCDAAAWDPGTEPLPPSSAARRGRLPAARSTGKRRRN